MRSGAAEARRGRVQHRGTVVVAIVAGVVALDQVTKLWAVRALDDGPVSVVGSTVELELRRNAGSAFSVVTGATPVLALVAAGIAWYLVRALRRTDDPVLLVALALVLGGALGNLADRVLRDPGFLRGEVVDFVRLGWWPTFNVADAAITVGAVLLVGWALLGGRGHAEHGPA